MWILKILHDPRYLIAWELWYYIILRSCRILLVAGSCAASVRERQQYHPNLLLFFLVTISITITIITIAIITIRSIGSTTFFTRMPCTVSWSACNLPKIYTVVIRAPANAKSPGNPECRPIRVILGFYWE